MLPSGTQRRTILLVIVDTPKRPGDHRAPSEVTVRIVKGITCAHGFKEKERNERYGLCQDVGLVLVSVDAKGLKSGEHNQDYGPAMVEREWDLHKNWRQEGGQVSFFRIDILSDTSRNVPSFPILWSWYCFLTIQ